LISQNTFSKLVKTKRDFTAHGRIERDGIDAYLLTTL